MTKFRDMLRYLRKSRGYTQETCAKKMGITRSALGSYESGERAPSFETLEMIADFFNVNMSTLLGEFNAPPLPEDTLSEPAKMLFMSLQGATDEEIEQAVKVINALRSK